MIAVACDEDGVVALDVAEVLGDEGFDSDAVRDVVLDDLGTPPAMPSRTNRKEPRPWDDEMRAAYRQRNRVERAFSKAKRFRRFVTRSQKMKDVYFGVARLVLGFTHVRKLAESVDTP